MLRENRTAHFQERTPMHTIQLEINCHKKTCGFCEYKTMHHTGLAGEFHLRCDIFPLHTGEWGSHSMDRAAECLEAEKNARK